MLLLHAYPHKHECYFRLYSNSASIVCVDFELKEDSPAVQIEIWTDIDGSWKGYPMPYIINTRGVLLRCKATCEWCKETNRVISVKAFNHTYGFKAHRPDSNEYYSAYGYLTFPKTVKQNRKAQCTYRGRYIKDGNWSEWYWIGARDRFGFERNAIIEMIYVPSRTLTNIRHICADCLRDLSQDIIPPSHLKFLVCKEPHYNCIICKRNISDGVSVTDLPLTDFYAIGGGESK